ncbi:MAG TPA: SDR family oxidoreductase [Pyrinomonadaceae bacterium]|nr:SDR family oxidoreductase [Pyrinomonadaceae bacterium]
MFDLTGKIALVTGAASGIGEAIAKTLANANAFVYVCDLDEANGKRVAEEIGEKAEFLKLNVAEKDECKAVSETVLGEKGKLDILVNNAGIGHVGTLIETTEEDLEKLFAVNVRGIFSLTKAFLPSMIERKNGVILNIASIGGKLAIRDRIAYCTTKFAVVGFTKCVALDHALQGIRANAICPGRVETPFVKQRLLEYADPAMAYAEMSATQALGRMGTPEEIGAAALYLSSDKAAFITGTALEIDGGWAVGK